MRNTIGVLAAAAAMAAMSEQLGDLRRVTEDATDAAKDMGEALEGIDPPEPLAAYPTEPPPEVAALYSDQELKAARKQRWIEGYEIPEADRAALEEAAARRARRAAKRK